MTKLELLTQNCNFNYSTQILSEWILQKFILGQSSEVIQEPLPLKPRILVKKLVVLVKRENGFNKTIPCTENPGKKEKSVLVNPISCFTKTTDFKS